MPAFAN
jgi:hypothetical protein